MLISGIQPFTLMDYPGKTACVVFVPGCNFRCGYCHNPEFVLPEKIIKLKDQFISEDAFFSFLFERKDLLDGVVVSGGEPTLAPDLIPFMQKIRRMGFSVKLDTNGNRSDVLQKALEARVVDYVAMDLKASLSGYKKLVGPLVRPERIEQSIGLLRNSTINYEFRSTLLKEFHSAIMLSEMAQLIVGAKYWYLQKFRPGTTLLPAFSEYHSYSDEELAVIAGQLQHYVERVTIR